MFALFMVLSQANMFTLFLCHFSRAHVFTLFMVLSPANMFTLFLYHFSRANVFTLLMVLSRANMFTLFYVLMWLCGFFFGTFTSKYVLFSSYTWW